MNIWHFQWVCFYVLFNFFLTEWWDLGRDLAPVRCEVDSWFFHFSAKIRKTGLCVLCLFSPSILDLTTAGETNLPSSMNKCDRLVIVSQWQNWARVT